MDDDENQLIDRIKTGETQAYRILVERHAARLTAYLASRLRDPVIVQDLVQETFIAAYQNLDSFQCRSLFSSWLIGIGHKKMLLHLRSTTQQSNREGVLRAELLIRMTPDLESLHEKDTEASLISLRACIDKLSPRIRAIVLARYLENETVCSIGERLGRSPDAVRAMLTRARRSMKICIAGTTA